MELVKMAQKYDPDYVSEDEMSDTQVIHDRHKSHKKRPKIYKIREEEYRRRYRNYKSSFAYSDDNSTEEIGFQNLTDDSALGFGNDSINESATNVANIENKNSFDIDNESFVNKVNTYSKHLHSDNYISKIQLGSSFDIFGKENIVDEVSEINEIPLEEDSGGEQSADDDSVSHSRQMLSNVQKNKDLSYSKTSLNSNRNSDIGDHSTCDQNNLHQGEVSRTDTEVEKSVFDLARERIIKLEKKKNAKLLIRQLQMTTEPKEKENSETKKSSAGSKNSEEHAKEIETCNEKDSEVESKKDVEIQSKKHVKIQSEKHVEIQSEKQSDKQRWDHGEIKNEKQSENAVPIEIEEEPEERYESLCEDVNPNIVELLYYSTASEHTIVVIP